jgi:hypothetical protein
LDEKLDAKEDIESFEMKESAFEEPVPAHFKNRERLEIRGL